MRDTPAGVLIGLTVPALVLALAPLLIVLLTLYVFVEAVRGIAALTREEQRCR